MTQQFRTTNVFLFLFSFLLTSCLSKPSGTANGDTYVGPDGEYTESQLIDHLVRGIPRDIVAGLEQLLLPGGKLAFLPSYDESIACPIDDIACQAIEEVGIEVAKQYRDALIKVAPELIRLIRSGEIVLSLKRTFDASNEEEFTDQDSHLPARIPLDAGVPTKKIIYSLSEANFLPLSSLTWIGMHELLHIVFGDAHTERPFTIMAKLHYGYVKRMKQQGLTVDDSLELPSKVEANSPMESADCSELSATTFYSHVYNTERKFSIFDCDGAKRLQAFHRVGESEHFVFVSDYRGVVSGIELGESLAARDDSSGTHIFVSDLRSNHLIQLWYEPSRKVWHVKNISKIAKSGEPVNSNEVPQTLAVVGIAEDTTSNAFQVFVRLKNGNIGIYRWSQATHWTLQQSVGSGR